MTVKVLVNGVGAIGKRVAHAVRLQKDMTLAGVSDVSATAVLRSVLDGPLKGVKLYASLPEAQNTLAEAGLNPEGTLEEVLASGEIDVVVDATPAGIEEKNKGLYEKYNVKQVYEGGAKASIAEVSFNANVNYLESFNKKSTRVVSCNTTSLARTIGAIKQNFDVRRAIVSLVRRAVDPWDARKGPINAIVPVLPLPSHHGPDLQTIIHDLRVETMAVKVPTTLAHTHMVAVELKADAEKEKVKEILSNTPRVLLLKGSDGYSDTALIIERFRDLLRPRYDMYETVIWDESVTVEEDTVYWMHAVHSEAIVIPENIDAIRAITGIEEDPMRSIKMTNESLGIFGKP
ncbi:type II glyceraldehyde-3-phosphate dehydrogenase [Candidatus Micrarchaeota archaeon]|nr:MAG: type II glyceraldehyde-3-phosphate dehydrogenase [Candidatus Micrarchaeota archaeon]